ncbi:MAG: AsmA-like C-terminal region-containing protein, partial [Salinivirgaceae bacterium]
LAQSDGAPQTDLGNEAAAGTQKGTASASASAQAVAAADKPEEEMYIPPYIARGTFGVKSVKYGDILLEDIATKFRVDDSLYVFDQFKFNAFGGSMVTSAVYDTRDTITSILFKNEIDGMDIHQMLVDADNFDQEDFTHENVTGIVTSSLDGRILMQDTTIFYDKINVLGRFKLENGGIYNFEPAQELAKYTNMKELDSIVFKTMESSVFIYNNDIYFPKTDIVSTAMDMSVFGMQSFNEDYEYHVVMYLNDFLLGKSKKLLEKQGKEDGGFGDQDESKRKGVYLVAMDRDGETKYGLDNKRLQRMMSTKIRLQDRGLSFIFHPRLVNFSTDIDRKEGVTKEAKDK